MKTRQIDLLYRLRWPWLYLRGTGPSKRPFNWLPQAGPEAQEWDLEVVFAGDLLGMGQQTLELSNELKTWIGQPDFLVFNHEAQIQTEKHLPLLRQSFRNAGFFQKLRSLLPNTTLIAAVANNHFHDFCETARLAGWQELKNLGYHILGTQTTPSLTLAQGLELHAYTAWVDQHGGAAKIEDMILSSQSQQLIFLHAGVEFSADPDPEYVAFEKNLPNSVLALVGHHTHRPSGIEQTGGRVVAWSLGNLCTPFGGGPVRWGQVMKLRLRKAEGLWAVVQTEWSYVNCHVSGAGAQVELKKEYPF